MVDSNPLGLQGDDNKTKTGDAFTMTGTDFKTDGANSESGGNKVSHITQPQA